MSKQKMIVIGITMNCAGSEKSFLSFVNCLDFEKFDVTLLLAEKTGLFLPLLPKEIHVIEMAQYGDMFTLSGGNAMQVILRDFIKRNPLTAFEVLPYAVKMKLHPEKRSDIAMQLWVHLMRHFPSIDEEYDIALAYWGDKTMFYMCDKVKAKQKIAWLHFDYNNPPREDALYLPFFKKCEKIVTVSKTIDASLKQKLPEIADRCVMMENINSEKLIWDMSETGDTFKDDFTGKRILTVGRISEQKGYDMAIAALGRLIHDGFHVRWYILGGGTDAERQALIDLATASGCRDALAFLGTTTNPYAYIRNCDIYAQPSRHEGKPIAVEEAKILHKPILITNYLSASDQLADGKLGCICEISPDGIYDGMKKLLEDESLCASYQEALSEQTLGNENEIQVFYQMLKA